MASRRDFWIVLGERLVSAFVAIASLRIMTTLLAPEDYGIYALLAAFQTFCGLFLVNPIGMHVNRHTHAWWDDGTLLHRLARYNRYLVAVSVLVTLAVISWWSLSRTTVGDGQLPMAVLAGLAVGAIVYLGTWNLTLIPILNMLGFRLASAGWMIVSALAGLVLSSLFVLQYHNAVAWIFGQALGGAIGAAAGGCFLRRRQVDVGPQVRQETASVSLLDRQTLRYYCLPLAVATGLMWIQNTGYRFWVGGVWGVAELGLLTIGLGIAAQLWTIAESLAQQFLYPYFYRRIHEAQADAQAGAALSDLVNIMGPIYALLAGFNAVFASALLNILTDVRYHTAAVFVLFGVLIELPRCLSNLWSNAAQFTRRTGGVILPYGLGALVVWGGVVMMAGSSAGLNHLAMVLVGAGAVTCAAMIYIMQRLLPVKLDVGRWAIGFVFMVICFSLALTMPIPDRGLYPNLGMLLVGGVCAGTAITAMLWRNPALIRLLAVQLRKE